MRSSYWGGRLPVPGGIRCGWSVSRRERPLWVKASHWAGLAYLQASESGGRSVGKDVVCGSAFGYTVSGCLQRLRRTEEARLEVRSRLRSYTMYDDIGLDPAFQSWPRVRFSPFQVSPNLGVLVDPAYTTPFLELTSSAREQHSSMTSQNRGISRPRGIRTPSTPGGSNLTTVRPVCAPACASSCVPSVTTLTSYRSLLPVAWGSRGSNS